MGSIPATPPSAALHLCMYGCMYVYLCMVSSKHTYPRRSIAAFLAALSMALSRDKARFGLEQWQGRRPTLYAINTHQLIHKLQLITNKTHYESQSR